MQGKRDHHLGPMQEGGNPPYAQSDLLMAKRTVIQGGQQCRDFAGCDRHSRHSCLIAEPESEKWSQLFGVIEGLQRSGALRSMRSAL